MDKITEVTTMLSQIQEALNELEVKGRKNAALLIFAFDRCNDISNIVKKMGTDSMKKMEDTNNGQQN